ncbi:DMP19 family protein [Methylobacterium sp. J-078]|uniref:DMP19 family protein n=1 Tax=Methylobacterium sp. J-078 TaxID=2836657 RepID=UPI001FB961FA|nr:DUF4375 domain-containing protein [Methylobacterium sp. J-078]MCJ2047706.1 DMP19 family protein [Methylobacterium sp. J-078]
MLGRVFGRRKINPAVPILDKILLTKEATNDTDNQCILSLNASIVNYFITEFKYLIPELPPAAIESYSVDYYAAQVKNGGHGQFAHNANGKPISWAFARSGLLAMGATKHLSVFDRFEAIIKRNDARARRIIEQGGFGEMDPEVEELDSAFYANDVTSSLTDINARWLKSRPNLYILPFSEMQNYIEGFSVYPGILARMAKP